MDLTEIIVLSCGGIVTICLSVIGWFMATSLKESRDNTLQIGILKGEINHNKEKSRDDVDALSKTTDIKIQRTTDDINMLTKLVNNLLDLTIKDKFKRDE